MVIGTEAAQLDLLRVLDFLCVTVAPLHRDIGVSVGIHQDVECTVSIKDGEEGNRSGNLPEDGLDLVLYLLFSLFNGLGGQGIGIAVD